MSMESKLPNVVAAHVLLASNFKYFEQTLKFTAGYFAISWTLIERISQFSGLRRVYK